ncbi:MAG TPA: hypothetical protein DCM40_28065 [Maribacter sp.]|jgi:hypothetical protein|nr:hypothetical protein [Maribacter sp.]|tara:strand:+ start:2588 stop:2938 length:351 start_codon:yes stop_codon:yes gene_type:complete
MANYNTFDDFYETMLEAEPQTAYMGAVGSQTFGRSLPDPTLDRARASFRNQFSDVYNQYLGQRGRELSSRTDPSKLTTFSSFLENYPFTQRYSAMTPYQRGTSMSRFNPSTRFIFY